MRATTSGSDQHRVVVVGGGFGGLQAVLKLRRAPVEVTLVDRRNFHLFQPLTYQVATGALSPGEIAYPLRAIFKRDRNVRVLMAEVADFDLAGRELRLRPAGVPVPASIPYDTLIVAGGSQYSYFGHDEWREHAAEVKSLESALTVRTSCSAPSKRRRLSRTRAARTTWLTFVVVGAGPTGVEMAGQIGELARDTLRRDFRADRSADGSHPARRGGRTRAHDVPALAVGEGRAIVAEARRDRGHRPDGDRYRRGERDDRGRERRTSASPAAPSSGRPASIASGLAAQARRAHRSRARPSWTRDRRAGSHAARASGGVRARRHGPRARGRRDSCRSSGGGAGGDAAGPLRGEGRARSAARARDRRRFAIGTRAISRRSGAERRSPTSKG